MEKTAQTAVVGATGVEKTAQTVVIGATGVEKTAQTAVDHGKVCLAVILG